MDGPLWGDHPRNVWNKPCRLHLAASFSLLILGFFSIYGFNPFLSLFRDSFQCWKRIKLKEVRACTVLTCTMAKMQSPKPLPPFLQLICTATAASDCTKSSFPYVKIRMPAIFFLKTRRSSKILTQSNSKQLLSRLVPSRTQFCDRPLELRTRLLDRCLVKIQVP